MIQIVCVLCSGGDYTAAHVEALRANCAEFMPPHQFLCLTDSPEVPGGIPFAHNWKGWWSKMEIFGPLVPDAPTLFLDLDTVIVAPCADLLAKVRGAPFVILRDFIRGRKDPLAMQSSVMFWESRPQGVYDTFQANPAQHIERHRGDQDFLETVIPPAICSYWQDYGTGFSSFKIDVMRRGVLPKDRIIVFHGKPRPWEQSILSYGDKTTVPKLAKSRLALRSGWVVPSCDQQGLRDALARLSDIDKTIAACKGQRRTVIQAGGSLGIWPAKLAKSFQRVISLEPNALNYEAMEINTADLGNVEIHQAALSDTAGAVGMCCDPRNIGAHYVTPLGNIPAVTIDSLGIEDLDLLQLDIEGAEHAALLGARATIEKSHPVIVLELKRHGLRFGHSDADTVAMLTSWGYVRNGAMGRDVIFIHHSAPGAEAQKAIQPSVDYSPIPEGQSCVLVGNGPSVLKRGLGAKIDAFDQVCRFNQFKIQGFESEVGQKTTLWATFGRGMLPHDGASFAPNRAIFIHGNNGDPAVPVKELWRIPRDFFWKTVEGWKDSKGVTGNQLLPSTGFLVAYWLLEVHKVPTLYLAGFDHFKKDQSSAHHYWNPQAYKRPAEHNGDAEAQIFAEWASTGQVIYL
jgi:FkbM family methyltransferase